LAIGAINGIMFLHSKNIIHRDIKTANFLTDEHFYVKVIDFGVSRVSTDNVLMTVIGTPVWMAPEVLKHEKYSEKADIYSIGLLIWSLFVGKIPNIGIDQLQFVVEITIENFREPIPDNIDPKIIKIIESAWDKDPELRPTLPDIIDRLCSIKHPITKRYYAKMHQYIEDDTMQKILEKLSIRDLVSISLVSKRFEGLTKEYLNRIRKLDNSDSSKEEKTKKKSKKNSSELRTSSTIEDIVIKKKKKKINRYSTVKNNK